MAKQPDPTLFQQISAFPSAFRTRDGKEVVAATWHPKKWQPLLVSILYPNSEIPTTIWCNEDGTFRHDGMESNLDIVRVQP